MDLYMPHSDEISHVSQRLSAYIPSFNLSMR